MRGLLDATYYTLTGQSSGNWEDMPSNMFSFINFESLGLFWIYFLTLQTMTPKISLIDSWAWIMS